MRDTLTIIEHQEIKIDEVRNVLDNTISHEDKELLFSIVHKDIFGKEKYVFSRKGRNGIRARSIVGSISLKNGLTVEILPKFAKGELNKESIKKYRKTLLNMIRVSNERNFISSTRQCSKVSAGEMPLIRYMIELFSESLLLSLRNEYFSSYNKTVEKSSYIKGAILVSKTIQQNMVDQSKVYISYNKYSSNNILMQIFRTLSKLLLNDTNLSYKAKQNLYEAYLLLNDVEIINLKKHDFNKIVFNRLNNNYETLFRQAEFIFNQYMPFTSSINSTPFWAILFNMDYLFEKFCAYLFRKSDIVVKEQSTIDCFSSGSGLVTAKPDFILYKDEKIVNVVDAKWRLLTDKGLHGLAAQNFWQLFSYMNLVSNNEINGYFIAPKNTSDIDDEIVFVSEKNGKSIAILSIDFSLDFEELIDKYRFDIIKNRLKIKNIEKKVLKEKSEKEVVIEKEHHPKKIGSLDFNDLIEELDSLNKDKFLRTKLLNNKKTYDFKNVIFIKESGKCNSRNFEALVKNNLGVNICDFRGFKIKEIPSNIIKLKKLEILKLSNNCISTVSSNICSLNYLKILFIDKEVVINNIEIMKKLIDKNVTIYDNKGKKLKDFINSRVSKNKVNLEMA